MLIFSSISVAYLKLTRPIRLCLILVIAVLTVITTDRYVERAPIAATTPSTSETQPDQAGMEEAQELPDFEAISDVNEKKERFFDYVHGFVDQENARILATRDSLTGLRNSVLAGRDLSSVEEDILGSIAQDYGLEDADLSGMELLEALLLRVDAIPVSLVLAQAANESAWGTSRFAKEGNNIFGMWCFSKGCGLVPKRRAANAIHEVKKFDSIDESVEAYFHTINTNSSYEYFRQLRGRMRDQNRTLDSLVLAYGLTQYSARGESYVSEVQAIIRYNDLALRDQS